MQRTSNKTNPQRRSDAHIRHLTYDEAEPLRQLMRLFHDIPEDDLPVVLAAHKLPTDLGLSREAWSAIGYDRWRIDTIPKLTMLTAHQKLTPSTPLDDAGVLSLWLAHKLATHPVNADPDNPRPYQRRSEDEERNHPLRKRIIPRFLLRNGIHDIAMGTIYKAFCCPHNSSLYTHPHIHELFPEWGATLATYKPVTRVTWNTLVTLASAMAHPKIDLQPHPFIGPPYPSIINTVAELEALAHAAPALLGSADTFRTYDCDVYYRRASLQVSYEDIQNHRKQDPNRVLLLTSPDATKRIDALYEESLNHVHHGLQDTGGALHHALRVRYHGPEDYAVLKHPRHSELPFPADQFLVDTVNPTRVAQYLSPTNLVERMPDFASAFSASRLSAMRTRPETLKPTLKEFSGLAAAFQLPLSYWLKFITDDYRRHGRRT